MFRDRADAGRRLADLVASRLGDPARGVGVGAESEVPQIMALPRGGVPVAAEVANGLRAPLDILVVRKIGVPWQPELALGAVGEGGAVVLNERVVSTSGVGLVELDALIRKASEAVEEIVAELRPSADASDVTGRTVVVVDDGIATGATARAAARILRSWHSGPVILAAGTAPPSTVASLRTWFDEVICVETPWTFGSVGQQFERFEQVSIGDVRRMLGGSPA